MTEKWLTVAEAAERLGRAAVTIRVWCQRGRFPHAQKRGRDWLIPERDLCAVTLPVMGRPCPAREETGDG